MRLRKLDPYLNVDPGTMSPFEHGEVFVTDDGAETDLDLGHYERFTGVAARRTDSISSGRIYSNVLEKERRGDYLGKTIQVIPHVTNEIKDFLRIGDDEVDFMLCEIGGTVGDIEGLPFFEAIRQFGQDKPRGQCIYMHLTLLPYMAASGELKTKPTQHSVKELRAIGIAPDVLVCRSEMPIPQKERDKLALFCNVRPEAVIAAQDLRLDLRGAARLPRAKASTGPCSTPSCISPAPRPNLGEVGGRGRPHPQPRGRGPDRDRRQVHPARGRLQVDRRGADPWRHRQPGQGPGRMARLRAASSTRTRSPPMLEGYHAILVPGGFGERGTEGKIRAARFARERKVPYLGICLGMQMAVIEASRNLLGLTDAGSEEFDHEAGERRFTHVIYHLKEWLEGNRTDQARGHRRQGRHDAARRLRRDPEPRAARRRRSTRRRRSPSGTATATRSTSPTATSSRAAACASPACRRTAGCRRSSRSPATRGSSACSSTPS